MASASYQITAVAYRMTCPEDEREIEIIITCDNGLSNRKAHGVLASLYEGFKFENVNVNEL